MNQSELIEGKIKLALLRQESKQLNREQDAIFAETQALYTGKNDLDPSSVRHQVIELLIEQLERRADSLKKWGADLDKRISEMNQK